MKAAIQRRQSFLTALNSGQCACIAVFEQRPYWGPELQRQMTVQDGDVQGFRVRDIVVRECRNVEDLNSAVSDCASAIILLDMDSSPISCLAWLAHWCRKAHRHPVIVCASTELDDLEWIIRETGVIAFQGALVSSGQLAKLCLRQLRIAFAESAT